MAASRLRLGREAVVDAAVHFVGVPCGVVAAAVLIAVGLAVGGGVRIAALTVYAFGLVAMLVSSAAYNLAPPSPRKQLLRRLDHGAIFIMIAGTYTPFLAVAVGGRWGWGLLAGVWLVAVAGTVTALRAPRRSERRAVVLYLLLGWSIVLAVEPLFAALPAAAIVLIAVGGILYSAGVLFYLWERLPYSVAIWHALVLAAAACHYVAILRFVALGFRA